MITTDGSTPSSPRCRCGTWPTPRSTRPETSAPTTPTSGWSGCGDSGSRCPTAASSRSPTATTAASRSASSWTGPGGSRPRWTSRRRPRGTRRRHAFEVAKVAAAMNTERIELAPEPGYGDVTLGLGLRRRPVRGLPQGEDRPARRPGRPACSRTRRSRHADVEPVPGQGVQVLHRRRHHGDPAAGPAAPAGHRDGGDRDRLRRHAHARAAGRPGLGVPDRDGLELPGRAGRAARAAGGEAQGPLGRGRPLRPGDRPVQPVAHHPRVDRARDRARPGARLRGRLRRHLVRHPRQAQHPAVRLAGDARHRRPHASSTASPPSATTTRAWPASPGT